MKPKTKNSHLLGTVALLLALLLNMSWIQSKIARAWSLSGSQSLASTDVKIEQNQTSSEDYETCTPVDGSTTTLSAHKSGEYQGEKAQAQAVVTARKVHCTVNHSSLFSSQVKDHDGTQIIVTPPDGSQCATGTCYRHVFDQVFPGIASLKDAVTKFTDPILDDAIKNKIAAKKEKVWEKKVASCDYEWKDSDDHSSGVKRVHQGVDRLQCKVDQLEEHSYDTDKYDTDMDYYNREVRPTLESMLTKGSVGDRKQAQEIIAGLLDNGDVDDGVLVSLKAAYQYSSYDHDLYNLLSQFNSTGCANAQTPTGVRPAPVATSNLNANFACTMSTNQFYSQLNNLRFRATQDLSYQAQQPYGQDFLTWLGRIQQQINNSGVNAVNAYHSYLDGSEGLINGSSIWQVPTNTTLSKATNTYDVNNALIRGRSTTNGLGANFTLPALHYTVPTGYNTVSPRRRR